MFKKMSWKKCLNKYLRMVLSLRNFHLFAVLSYKGGSPTDSEETGHVRMCHLLIFPITYELKC